MSPGGALGGAASDLRWLFSLQRFGMRPGLQRTRTLLDALGEPQRAFRSVLVGGTNGKGATAAALASALEAAGDRTGLFVSPHLTRPEERFVIAGRPIAPDVLRRHVGALRPHAEALEATFFEAMVALAALAFRDGAVRTAVMEVGMGGRLDATNAFDPVASIVTNVALDHTEVLGDSVEAIAREKAGILRSGRPAWSAARGSAAAVLAEEAERLGATLELLDGDAEVGVRTLGWQGLEVRLRAPEGALTLRSPWLGRHQGIDLALAARAARGLGCDAAQVVRGISAARWPGRLEPIAHRGRRILLDGAHNPAAARALVAAWDDLGLRRPALVLGLSREKDLAGVADALRDRVGSVVATRARHSPRARDPRELAEALPGAVVEPDPVRALARAVRDTSFGGTVAVAGSLYLVGELRPWLLGEAVPPYARWQ